MNGMKSPSNTIVLYFLQNFNQYNIKVLEGTVNNEKKNALIQSERVVVVLHISQAPIIQALMLAMQ